MKRTELVRRTPLRAKLPDATPKPAPGPRKRRCRAPGCSNRYTVSREQPFVCWCSPECAEAIAKDRIAKQKAKQQRQERAQDKIKREGMKKRGELIAEAQAAVNAYVRYRDRNLPCICCGKWAENDALTGGGYDAGHYLSRGSHPHLRFDADRNIFRQRKSCNRPGGTTAAAFRAGVIARIGLAAVEALEADNTPRKWTHDELRAIKAHYKQKLKELQNGKDR